MTPERWAQIEDLFHRVAEADPACRQNLLDEACSGDSELRKEVEALLDRDERAAVQLQANVVSEFHNIAFPLIGKTISHYQILESLGSGGMGLVYLAQDIKLPRKVAVKFLPEDSAKAPDALRRFEREARAASALEHSNICPIYEFGEHEGQPFIVMPLLDGQTVEQFIHTLGGPAGSKQIQNLLDISVQVLKGLGAAHEHGIVHRDIKPGNIFLSSSGEAKILDFGIAKLGGTHESNDHPIGHATKPVMHAEGLTLSRTGAIVGTAAYMSPEQVRGERVDARTDIFSFGLVLYELATGKRAFGGNTWPVLQEAVLTGIPKPARGLNSHIPVKLENIINKAIEKNREARYQTAAGMRADLEALRRQLDPKHLPRAWAIGLTAAGVIVVGILLWVLNRPPKTISVTPEIRLRQLTTNSSENPVNSGSISPDGKYLEFSDTKGLHLKLMETGETRSIPMPEELKNVKWEQPAWFPDSTGFLMNIHPGTEDWNEWSSASASIWAVSVRGGPPTKLREHAAFSGISPDGATISFATNKGKRGDREIWFMARNGEDAKKFQEVSEDHAICCLGWSPDGKRYWYILTDESGDNMLSRDVNGGSPVTLFRSSEVKNMNDAVWLHDGRIVYSLPEAKDPAVSNYWTMRLNLATGKRIEEPRRLTNFPGFGIGSGSVTSDDKTVAFTLSSSFGTSYVADLERDGREIRNLRHFTLEDGEDGITAWVDRKTVLVTQNRKDHYSLYKQALDSDAQEPIISSVGGGLLYDAILTPDGKWIVAHVWPVPEDGAVESHPSVLFPLVRIPLAGGPPETILQVPRPAYVSCARPPSRVCVMAEDSDDHKQIIVSDFDPIKGRGAELARFALTTEVDPFLVALLCRLSPDGTRLAIARSPEGPIEIRALRGRLIRTIPAPPLGRVTLLAWTADGKGIFVTRRAHAGSELLHLNLQGRLQSLRLCVGGCFATPSPDGRHLAIFDNQQSRNMWMMENF